MSRERKGLFCSLFEVQSIVVEMWQQTHEDVDYIASAINAQIAFPFHSAQTPPCGMMPLTSVNLM